MDKLLEQPRPTAVARQAGLALTNGQTFAVMAPTGTPMDPRRAIEYHDHQMALVAWRSS